MKIVACVMTIFIFPLCGCSPKTYSLEELPKEYIQIGSYGGFAGNVTTRFFFPNGQRFIAEGIGTGDGVTSSKEIEPFTCKEFKEMKASLSSMNFEQIILDDIGNMTYFIRLKNKKTDHTVQWNNLDTAPEALVLFYNKNILSLNTDAIN